MLFQWLLKAASDWLLLFLPLVLWAKSLTQRCTTSLAKLRHFGDDIHIIQDSKMLRICCVCVCGSASDCLRVLCAWLWSLTYISGNPVLLCTGCGTSYPIFLSSSFVFYVMTSITPLLGLLWLQWYHDNEKDFTQHLPHSRCTITSSFQFCLCWDWALKVQKSRAGVNA